MSHPLIEAWTQMTAQPAPPTPNGKQALLEAFSDVLRSQAQAQAEEAAARKAAARARARRQFFLWTVVVALLGANAYIWTAKPTWLFPPPAPGESLEMKEASLRIAMAKVAAKVTLYQQRHGRLPNTLTEAGASYDGVRYVRQGGDFELTGVNGPVALSYRSGESLDAFVGNSYQLIARRAGR